MSATPYYRVDPEHSGEIGREVRIFGPPGTGKTTFLAGSIRNTALLRGGHNVLVASFTTTAAAELKGRDLPLPKSQIGTLHSLAYRQLDRPPVADEVLEDWNTNHPSMRRSLSARAANVDDGAPLEAGAGGATDADALAAKYDNLRNRMLDRDHWPVDVREYAKLWEAWKREQGVVDFTDMIEMALADVGCAPGNPDVGFFDEVQDFTPLELSLIRKWGAHMERVILAGDDDQAIYGFKGATPDAFLKPDIPDHDKIVLSQSWRIPASVHRAAEHWIRQLGHREQKLYSPRAEEGLVRRVATDYTQVLELGDHIEASLDTEGTDADGNPRPATVMVLATCGYMLDPIKHELRARGLPFHNPYRTTRGDWNPFRKAVANQVSSRERLLAYLTLDERDDVGLGDLSRPWTGEDVRRWAHVVKKQGIFRRGAAAMLEGLPGRELEFDEIAALFADEVHLERAVTPDLDWLEQNLLTASRQPMAYPIEVARKRGAKALLAEPRVILGTIHSVKGGQADVVYLIPDLSARGSNEWRGRMGQAGHDGVRRQMYVGMTRARRELVLMGPATSGGGGRRGPLFVDPEQMVAGVRANAA